MKPKLNSKVLFLTSKDHILPKLFSIKNPNYRTIVVFDRSFKKTNKKNKKDIESNYEEITFSNNNFKNNKKKYFQDLIIFISNINPDIIITSNYYKLLPDDFINYFKFLNSNLKIINIHHSDLRFKENNNIKYDGLKGHINHFLDNSNIISTIHHIEDYRMDLGTHITYSKPTYFKELKNKNIIKNKYEILIPKLENIAINFHERTKIVNILSNIITKNN